MKPSTPIAPSSPEQNAEFVYRMEDVLDVYQRPLDEKRPIVFLDEASKQLLSTHGGKWASLMADSTIFVLPIVVLFFTQKTFV